MSYEIETALIRIDGEWWWFKGMTSIAWMVRWSEKQQKPYIAQDTGDVFWGERMASVMFG